MKQAILLTVIIGLIFTTNTFANELELVEVYQSVNHNGHSYKAYIFGTESVEEPPIRRLENCVVEGGCVPDEYLINEVTVGFADHMGNKIEDWKNYTGPFLYFGETYGVFYNASYDKNKKWKGWIVKKIVLDFYGNFKP
jgi:hypothetical protein